MKFMGSGNTGSRGGKGFYIVLLLCAAVLGTSGWIAIKGAGTHVETQEAADAYVRGYQSEAEPADEPEAESLPVMAEAETVRAPEAPLTEQPVSYIRPVEGGVQRPYSMETLLYDATMQDWRTHGGIDYAAADGSAVAAAADGVVVSVTEDGLLGTTITLSHADGLETVYANLAPGTYVRAGENVTQGQIIASVGTTALSEANEAGHLHFAMQRDGAAVDPGDHIE